LAGGELFDGAVGVVGELEKICSSRCRKLACRGVITLAGGGCSRGGGTCIGTCAGSGDAQDDATSASSSHVAAALAFGILKTLFIVGSLNGERGGLGGLESAIHLVETVDLSIRDLELRDLLTLVLVFRRDGADVIPVEETARRRSRSSGRWVRENRRELLRSDVISCLLP
jgi:hypothetical protein